MNDKTVVFISGRISGDPGYKAKFNEAQYRLENVGFKVLNPVDAARVEQRRIYADVLFNDRHCRRCGAFAGLEI